MLGKYLTGEVTIQFSRIIVVISGAPGEGKPDNVSRDGCEAGISPTHVHRAGTTLR